MAPAMAGSTPPSDAFRYVYDADGRLKAAIDPEGDTATYDWDAAGNLLSIGRNSSTKLSIFQLTPAKGAVGETIEIEGTGFSEIPASNTVKFNGVAATVEAATPWSLKVKVPAGATSGPLTVSTSEEGPVSQGFTVTNALKPSIASVEPSVAEEGEEVTVSGSNFDPARPGNVVTANSVRATVLSPSASSIDFEVPPDRLGGRVSVTTPEGTVVGPDLFVPPGALAISNVGTTGRFSLEDSKTVEFEAGAKVALLLFDGVAGEAVSLVFSGATRSGSVAIWSPTGSKVANGSTTFAKGGSAIAGPATLPETGTYTVAVGGEELGAGTVSMASQGFQHVTGSIVPTLEGTQRSVSIPTPGQEARYSISATAGQGASLKTTNSAISGPYDVKWLNPSGQVIKSWSHAGSQNSFRETVAFPTTGTYTLVIDPISSHTGTVDLTVWDGIHDAGTITPSAEGESKTLPLKVPGGNAKATFSGTAGQRVLFDFSEITFNGFVGIHTPKGSAFSGSEGSLPKGGSKVLEMTLPETGTYTVWLIQGGSTGETGSVKATAYAPPADIAETIVPSEEGAQKTPSISAPGQNARYSVGATAGQAVSLKTTNSAMSGNYRFEWLNPSGQAIKSWSHTGSQNSFREAVTFPTAGTYTLVVNPEGAATGSVTLTAWDASVHDTGPITPSSEGASKTLPLKVPNGTTKATFAGTAGQRVLFNFTEITFSAYVGIHTPKGSAFSGSEGPLPKGGSQVFEMTLPETGTYTVWLVPQSNHGETGSVKATAYAPPADLAETIVPSEEGAQKTVSISAPGQNARYSVAVEAGDAVSVKTSSASFNGNYSVEWRNPSGGLVASNTWSGTGSGFWTRREFTIAGTYTLVVNPVGTATGSVTLTAWDAPIHDAGTITPSAEGETKTLPLKVPGAATKATFAGTAGQKLKFDFTEITFSAYVGIHTPKGSAFSGSEGALPKGGSKVFNMTLPETGTYTVWLVPQGNHGETGSVKLTSYLEPLIAWPSPIGPTAVLVRAKGLAEPDVYSDVPGSGAASSRREASDEGPDRMRAGLSGASPVAPSWLPRGVSSWRPEKRGAWLPPRSSFERGWIVGGSPGPWAKIAPRQAAPGTTAVSGQVLKVDGLPLRGARISVKGTSVSTRTDVAGRFLLSGIPAGRQILVIDGEAAPAKQRYGSFEAGVDVVPGRTTVLDYTTWMTPLDKAGNRAVASPTREETRITTPRIPGFEVRLPAGTVIRNAAGDPVEHLNVTAIPVNRPAFPLPPFLSVPVYFTVQPGRAYLSKGARVIYPNWGNLPPGQRVDFWNYDPTDRGWYVYGRGEVTPDGKQVVPDPGVRVWRFTGAMVVSSQPPPGEAPGHDGATDGDPVDLYTGLFTYRKTDLVLPDTMPIRVERTYRPNDSNSYSFGRGMTSPYDLRLWSTNSEKEADLILPDGGRVHFVRTSPGSGETTAVFEATKSPSVFSKATITYAKEGGGGWDLTLTNGMTFVFDPFVLAPLREIRDRHGNSLDITRSGEVITQITSPHGRWVKFSYDGSNRITEVTDNGGRSFKYAYTSGKMTKVEAPGGRTTEYEYDGSDRMKAVINPRGNKFLQNEYDANGRVKKQTTGDGGTFEFAYELDEAGEVKATTVTDPRGYQRKVAFNSEGFPVSETEALGTEAAQTTSWERQPETGLVLSRTDPLGRETEFEYDSSGNVKEVTRLADTEDAVTTKIEYEPGTTNVVKVTDPLGHETTFDYAPGGELLSRADALENETTFTYNGEGQIASLEDPEGNETKFAYENGDLAAVTDPLGRTTTRFVDALGRVRAITSPGGQRTLLAYDEADRLTSVTSPSGAKTTLGYDKDGDLVSLTDPRENETTMTYDVMDRLESQADPLEQTEEWEYDKAGNLIEAISASGEISKYSYDELGRLAKARFGIEGESAESTIEYTYDDANRVVGIDDSASGEYVLEYDDLDRLTSVSGPNGTVGYAYDDAGRRTAMSVPGQEALAYEYDDANRLLGLTRSGASVSLGYDKADRLTSLELPDGIQQLYEYDKASQVTGITYEKGEATLGDLKYAYDADGRTEAVWGSYARLALPTALSAGPYNAVNQLTKRGEEEFAYDADGNLVEDGANEYAWNARGELTGIAGGANASFAYDPFGRRISKTLGGTTTKMLYDGPNVVQESVGGSLTASLITGLGIDQLFSRTTSAGTDSYLTDRLGSTIALADNTGEVDTTYTYEPFGKASSAGAPSSNPFQFTGRENDGTGLQFNRARYYDPSLARFISPDPLGFEGSGSNLYWYADGNPLDLIDPMGESALGDAWDATGGEAWDESAGLRDRIGVAGDGNGGWVSEAPEVGSGISGFLSGGVFSYGTIVTADIYDAAGEAYKLAGRWSYERLKESAECGSYLGGGSGTVGDCDPLELLYGPPDNAY